jgi:hypothetical protein
MTVLGYPKEGLEGDFLEEGLLSGSYRRMAELILCFWWVEALEWGVQSWRADWDPCLVCPQVA